MINHTSKRVLSNTVAITDLLRERLDRAAYQGGAAAPGADEVVALARRIVQEVR